MPNIGPLEIAVVLVIVLIIFGPKRLPELGRSMGRGSASSRARSPGTRTRTPEEQRRELQASQAAERRRRRAKPAEPVEGEVVTENKA